MKVELGEQLPDRDSCRSAATPRGTGADDQGKRVMIVTNTVVAPCILNRSFSCCPVSGGTPDPADGEAYKTLATFRRIMSALLETSHGRDTTLIALGAV